MVNQHNEIFFLVFSFGILDVWLRVQSRWIGAYSIFELAPNLFTLLWSIILVAVVTIVPSRRAGRILYGILYYFFLTYTIIQYGSYLILGKFLYISDFMYAGEGGDYSSWVLSFITPSMVLWIIVLILIGVCGIVFFPTKNHNEKKITFIRLGTVCLCVIGLFLAPKLYGETVTEEHWDDFFNPAFEYKHFTNVNFDMELAGEYQFLARDVFIQINKLTKDYTDERQMVESFFSEKADHSVNSMTGIFAGKNVLVFMMESMDDWLITPEDTPTIYKMMSEGINFTNMYTPDYSSGYTFNTEFAFNTGVYPYSNGNVAYSLQRNAFPYSIANTFADAGYSVNSFHSRISTYYNRGQMHEAFGYTKYHSYQEYPSVNISVLDDRYLTKCDELYADVVGREPFFSFIITYSPHLPYTDKDELAQTALSLYPQYDQQENREVAILRAKAKLTDDMFAELLRRLEQDGLLADTVIIGFADHYAYALSDSELLQQLSENAGNSILENTPAFIYCSGLSQPIEVEKVMQTIDLAPTILNLFGLDVPKETMGHDVFDDSYIGYAIFPNGTWLTNTAYIENGNVVWNSGMTDGEITEMNSFVQHVYLVNDAILDSDFYRQK